MNTMCIYKSYDKAGAIKFKRINKFRYHIECLEAAVEGGFDDWGEVVTR